VLISRQNTSAESAPQAIEIEIGQNLALEEAEEIAIEDLTELTTVPVKELRVIEKTPKIQEK
jgi:hypothetical protein